MLKGFINNYDDDKDDDTQAANQYRREKIANHKILDNNNI